MTLPEPNFIERDANKITQEWIALYESKTGKTLQPAQIERILIDVGVYRETLLRISIQEAAKQNLLNYATYPVIDYLGELVGVCRIQPKSSVTTIRFKLTEAQSFAVCIPVGTQIESKDGKVIFKTISDTLVPAGSLYIDTQAQALIEGVIGNGYLQGEIKTLVAPLPYIESVENITESAGGADEEDDDSLRERIKTSPERFSSAGPKGAYRFWAMSAHQDIIDVAVLSKSPGTVNIYPLTKYGNPTNEILKLVSTTLTDDKIRPLTDYVVVDSPDKIDFQIAGSVILYNYADTVSVQAEINSKLEEYCVSLKSKLGKDIVPTQIIALLNSIYGVFKVDLNIPGFTEVFEYQWANCIGYQINIAGYTNG